MLDEAQFVKNHQSKAYQCARKLPAAFKLAITGTPLENNLMEFWALTSIVAPGLFSSPKRFAEYYQKPVEKNGDKGQLDKLRRRVRPLMMRRTKDQVIKDLPPKQEQILEVVLNPRHQKVYQTHLQRERQKILGLIEDVNKNRFTIFQSLTLLRQLSLDASLVDPSLVRRPVQQAGRAVRAAGGPGGRGPPGADLQPVHRLPRARSASALWRRRSSSAISTAAPGTVPTSSMNSRTAARRCS